MGSGCCKGDKTDKKGEQINGKAKKNTKLNKIKSQKKKKNQNDVGTKRSGNTIVKKKRRVTVKNNNAWIR